MSSSLQNERYRMLLSSILVILLPTIKKGSATDLLDLPLSMNSKSVNINATLTDSDEGTKYFIQESISASGSTFRGKIVISDGKDSFNIYYSTDSNLNKNRLVIHGTNCLPFTFKNKWEQTLPGIKKPVTNLVLLMGPSILYRFDHSSLVWTSVAAKSIRGTMMKGARTEINRRLGIRYYYKKHFDEDYGIKHPSRIEFSGNDPYSTQYSYVENLVLDIYLQDENYYYKIANEVQPLPGIGCPYYFTTHTFIPALKADYVHYTMYEYIKGSTTSRTFSEIHASGKNKLLRIKSTLLGLTTEAIYDYKLGVSFLLQEGGSCRVSSVDLDSPGISSHGYFNLDNLFLFDFIFKYLGKLNLEHRSGLPVDAWEAIEYNVNINGKKADKAVITHYFAKSGDNEIFDRYYTLVSTTVAIYKSDSSKKNFTLTDEITRDYMNFEQAGFEDELHEIFTLKDCKYLSSNKKLTLAFVIQRKDKQSSQELAKNHVYALIQDFMYYIIFPENISPLRIDTVQYNLNDAQIGIEVTFLDSPDFQYILNTKTMSVSADTFEKMKPIKANYGFDCVHKLSKIKEYISVIIYRPSDSSCGYLTKFEDLKEDTKTGEPCIFYHFPLQNLQRIDQELPLDQIHNTYLQNLLVKSHGLFIGSYLYPYELIDIIDKTENKDASASRFPYRIRVDAKLKISDQATVTLPDVKTLDDCYRICHNSENFKCNTYSYCQNGDCRVSSLLALDSYNESHVEQDKSCSIYTLNVLHDYAKVPQRKFKTQTSIAVDKSVDYCAKSCHASPDCLSFQWCHYQCSFGTFYTDSSTEYDEECSIYLPIVSEKYQKTGNKIVSDVLYTEMNLNFEQCASLCHGWSDGQTGCKSFNYCPKSRSESSCSLTQFSVESSNTKTTEGGDCSNYELKADSNGKKSKESISNDVTEGTSGSDAIGIIILFLFVGALLGFAAPFGYTKVKQMRNASEANESFNWTRQVNEEGQAIEIIDIIDKKKPGYLSRSLSIHIVIINNRANAKLKSNKQVTVTVPHAKTLADCYRNCHNSEQLKCNTFSFCQNGDCRVSSLLTDDSANESHVEQNKSCSIHALNVLNDYSEIPHRKFKTQTSIAVDKSVDYCAEYCHASPDCFSFQWCDFQCSFGGFYTDAATEYDGECSVYLPKVSGKYQKTGNKIVSDVLHTEMNLNFEQCASLCDGWSDGDTGFEISNAKTTEGGVCSNYELKVETNGKKSKESSSTDVMKGTSGSDAFGIILLFLFVGALLGWTT